MIPPRTILAGVDFSPSSLTALTLAARLVVHCRSVLHVVHAQDPLLQSAASHQGRTLTEEALEELRRAVTACWPAASCDPSIHAVTGPAADVLLDISAREHADVIVVGSHGMSGVERALFGSVAEYVLRKADTSVLLVPTEWTAPRHDLPDLTGIGPIVSGFDFREPSFLASGAAVQLAAAVGTSVDLVHVVPDAPVLQRWRADAEAAVRERLDVAARELPLIASRLGGAVPVHVLVERGDVADQLTRAVQPRAGRSPLLVLGRRSGHIRGALPGAVAYRTLMRVAAPVLVYLNRGSVPS